MLSLKEIHAQRARAHEPVVVRAIGSSLNGSGQWKSFGGQEDDGWNWRPILVYVVFWLIALSGMMWLFEGKAHAAEAISTPYERAVAGKYYRQGLDQNCPRQHLEWIYPSQAADLIAAFEDTLKPEERTRFDAAMKPDLDQCEAGADCLLNAYVIAANRLNLTADLGAYMCREAKMTCTAAQDCEAVDTP